MEGTASTFAALVEDVERRLPDADFIAIDCEMTGTTIVQESLFDSVEQRYQNVAKAASTFRACQVGLALAKTTGECKQVVSIAAYNIFLYPFFEERKVPSDFMVSAAALRFLSKCNFDFNRWIKDGVMGRPRAACEAAGPAALLSGAGDFSRLWNKLCESRKPIVGHSVLTDLAFLMAACERNPLPESGDAFSELVNRFTPMVYDTAHLFYTVGAAIGKFNRLGLAKYTEEAVQRVGDAMTFELVENGTKERYGGVDKAHEAGFDAVMTAKLFASLRLLAPFTVEAEAGKCFLWLSTECVDLRQSQLRGSHVYYPGCRGFIATFPQGVEKSWAELSAIRTAGGQWEKIDDNTALILCEKEPASQGNMLTPIDLPPRRPQNGVAPEPVGMEVEPLPDAAAVKAKVNGVKNVVLKKPAAKPAAKAVTNPVAKRAAKAAAKPLSKKPASERK